MQEAGNGAQYSGYLVSARADLQQEKFRVAPKPVSAVHSAPLLVSE